MSSNHVERHRPAPGWRRWIRGWRSPSITVRLALLYALLTFAVLLTATAVLYWSVVVSLAHDDQRFLAEKIHVLRTMLSERPNDQALLREEVDWETRVIGHSRYFVQILDNNGRVVTQTAGLGQTGINLAGFPKPIRAGSTDPRMRWIQTASGRRYLLSAAYARLGSGGAQRVVRLAVDVSHEDHILGYFRHIAELVLLVGVLLSAGLGALVARFGLRPLGRLARTVEETTALRLNQRITTAAWPAEFVPLANAFNQLLAHLEGAFAHLSGYAADLAHELRTPINNLMGETEVTLARPRTSEDYEQTLASNLEEYQRIGRMIDSLLFLARAENNGLHQTQTRFDAGDALAEVAESYRPVAEDAGITLRQHGHGPILADRDLLRRAVGNLVDNAIRHSAPGVEVQVSVDTGENGTVMITVADTGRGIADDEQHRVFDRFFRGAATRAVSGGSGLGLAIVKSILWLHGGEVRLSSESDRGTKVILLFPPREHTTATPPTKDSA